MFPFSICLPGKSPSAWIGFGDEPHIVYTLFLLQQFSVQIVCSTPNLQLIRMDYKMLSMPARVTKRKRFSMVSRFDGTQKSLPLKQRITIGCVYWIVASDIHRVSQHSERSVGVALVKLNNCLSAVHDRFHIISL